MNHDLYAAPLANLDTQGPSAAMNTSPWTATGRLSVLSYWGHIAAAYSIMLLFLFVVFCVAYATGSSLDSFSTGHPKRILATLSSGEAGMAELGALTFYAVFAYLGFCLVIKRLHDQNHSGWWSILCLIPLAGFTPLAGLIPVLYISLVPGSKLENRFGGRRETRGWEKVFAMVYLLLAVVTLGSAIQKIYF